MFVIIIPYICCNKFSLLTIILFAVPTGNGKKKKGKKNKITVKMVDQSKSVNVKREQRAAHTPNKHRS